MSLRRCIRFRDRVVDGSRSTERGPWMSQDEAKPRPKGTDRLRALQIRRKCKIDLSTPGAIAYRKSTTPRPNLVQ